MTAPSRPDGGPARSRLEKSARAAGVRDPRVLAAMAEVRRGGFVPAPLQAEAEFDIPLRIGHGQTTSEPSLIGMMVETLRILSSDVVLEVGTGFGYQTAILARLAREVWSIERIPELADAARANLAAAGALNARVVAGDGTLGLPEHAPYDGIVVSAAFPVVPVALGEQLALGRRLVQPVGPGGAEIVSVFEKRPSGLMPIFDLCPARFVPLISEQHSVD